jgi:hypothetical protein
VLHPPYTRGSDGSIILLVYTDEQTALLTPQSQAGFSLTGRVVLEMAASNPIGVIVATSYGTVATWAGVQREHVAEVLTLAEKNS